MINWYRRYRPIVAHLRQIPAGRVLDVGSGPEGVSNFWDGPVFSYDMHFKRRPLAPAVRGDARIMPFAQDSWPIVVCCDMLEHIPPGDRESAVAELARVCAGTLLLAFPSGPDAAALYQSLEDHWGVRSPEWLLEHLAHGLPEAETVVGWLQGRGFQVRTTWFESARAHARLMRLENQWWFKPLPYITMRLFGRWLAAREVVRSVDDPLRVLLIAEK